MSSVWVKHKIGERETQVIEGVSVSVVYGWRGIRFCGCTWSVGLRLDTNDPVFGVAACPAHPAVVDASKRRIGEMPPNDRVMYELYQEVFEQALQDAMN